MSREEKRARPETSRPYRRLLSQVAAMVVVGLAVGGVALLSQYRTAREQQLERLLEVAQSQARLIEAIVGHHRAMVPVVEGAGAEEGPDPAFQGALEEIRSAHARFGGFGETGEFILGMRQGDRIVFLLTLRHGGTEPGGSLSFNDENGEPIRRALLGRSGTLVGMDYRGVRVLAAHEPLAVGGLTAGIVAKIDHAEFRRPFLITAVMAGLVGILFIGLGSLFVHRIGEPLIRRLEESEKRYRRFFQDSQEAMALTAPDGRLLEANQAGMDLFEFSWEEIGGRDVTEFYVNPEDRNRLLREMERAGVVKDFPSRFRLPNGKLKDVLLTSSARSRDDGPVVFETVIRDVSAQRRAEERLRESEALFRSLAESSPRSIFIEQGGRLPYLNPEAMATIGYSKEETLSPDFDWRDLIAPDTAEVVMDAYRRFSDGQEPEPFEFGLITKGGERRDVVAAGRLITYMGEPALLGAVTDISAQKATERLLKEERDRAQLYLDTAEVMLLALDAEGRVAMINRKGCEILGWEEAELVGRDWFEMCLPDREAKDYRSLFHRLRQGELEGEGNGDWESPVLTRNGEERLFAWRNRVVEDSDGQVIGSLSSGEDLTERRRAEEALRASDARFRSLMESTSDAAFCYEYAPPIPTDLPVEEQVRRLYDGVLVECNSVAAQAYGAARPDRVLGKGLLELFGADLGDLDGFFRAFIEGGYRLADADTTEVLPDGRERHFRNSGTGVIDEGRLLRVWGSFRDITEQKQAELTLRDSLQTSADIAEMIPAGLFIYRYSAPDRLTLVYGNPEAEALTGLRVDDWLGRDFDEIWPQARALGITDSYLEVARTGDTLRTEDVYADGRLEGVFRVHVFRLPGERLAVSFEDVSERRRAEDRIRRSRERLKALASRLQDIREDERTLIARELHDELGQAITSLRMDLAMLRRDLPSEETELHRRVEDMIRLADDNIVLVRSISSRLRPPVLDVLGLPAAIEWLVEEVEPRTEMVFRLDVQPEASALGREASTGVFRIVQEALTNVLRHSGAELVEVRMRVEGSNVVVEVSDDGVGISPEMVESPGSLGLTGMFERAEALGGSLDVRPDPGGGTRVSLSVPFELAGPTGGTGE